MASEYLTVERYSSEARVDVHIVSASRPTPHFTQPIYTAAVDENAPRGTALLASVTVRRLTVLYCSVPRAQCRQIQ